MRGSRICVVLGETPEESCHGGLCRAGFCGSQKRGHVLEGSRPADDLERPRSGKSRGRTGRGPDYENARDKGFEDNAH